MDGDGLGASDGEAEGNDSNDDRRGGGANATDRVWQ